ncbi:polysaccharide biosynthesis C-terminal domain-containing protein [Paenibacillus arenosi]|uniref:Polysaccharide biosynthesis C-terminal domain-containing protein n=1 Tax=Paenibacillus arenosi TaxID=2774142 RepID=A0ABR9B177_9BACL|nr:polysaccharide biosynthesis C-terminal domain-containing protein [Paenibacillus arenosi]MBD8500084.1 polysaccharide biosynthesis C-terminal domain-containing protein [Paenibacillus arenosi]
MRSKLALYNLSASLALQFITALVGIILPRFIIEAYGSSMNGMIASITQVMRYLSIVEAGLGAACIAALYLPLANNDTNQVSTVLSAARMLYNRTGKLFAIFAVVAVLVYPFLVYAQVPVFTAGAMVLIMAGGGLSEYYLIGKYRVLLIADQKSYIISLIQSAGVVINAVVCILLITFGVAALTMQAAATFIFASRAVFIKWYITRKYKQINYRASPDMESLKQRKDVFIHQLNGLVVFGLPPIINTIFCNLQEVSVYSVYSMVFVAVNMFVASFTSGVMASFGQLLAKGDVTVLRHSFKSFEYVFGVVLTWVYACTALLLIPFIQVYTSGIRDADYIRPDLAMLFVAVGVVSNLRTPHHMIVQAAGHFRETRIPSIIEAAISVIASLLFVRWFGASGVLLGMLCAHLYRTPELIWYTNRTILGRSPMSGLIRNIRNIGLGVGAALLCSYLFTLNVDSLWQWFNYAVITAIVVLVIVVAGNLIGEPNSARTVLVKGKTLYRGIRSKWR